MLARDARQRCARRAAALRDREHERSRRTRSCRACGRARCGCGARGRRRRSAVLNTVRLAQNGYANIFYSAGVRSMLRSLHNFLFVSFDPGGLVTVDKPPLALWAQAASAKMFGFSPLSLLLPRGADGRRCGRRCSI